MSGRARAPVGASERVGIFGTPTTSNAARSSEAGVLSSTRDSRGGGNRRDDIPVAMTASQQQQIGSSVVATPFGVLSPGRRRYTGTQHNEIRELKYV